LATYIKRNQFATFDKPCHYTTYKSRLYPINLPPTFQIWLILLFEITASKFLNLNPKN